MAVLSDVRGEQPWTWATDAERLVFAIESRNAHVVADHSCRRDRDNRSFRLRLSSDVGVSGNDCRCDYSRHSEWTCCMW